MNPKVDTVRIVEAPEGVELGLRVAGPFPRALAYLVDLGLRCAIAVAAAIGLAFFGGIGQGAMLVLWFLLEWAWPVVFEVGFGGATPGKRALRLQVRRDDGTPVGWSESLLRNLMRALDILPIGYGVGLVACLFNSDFKRLGDLLAGTVVVHVDERARIPALVAAPPLTPPFALTREEQAAVVDFAARVPTLTAARAEEIAERLGPLTGERGAPGLLRVVGMAQWIEGAR